jgi:predicted nucleotidyltransferase component of viral defense system
MMQLEALLLPTQKVLKKLAKNIGLANFTLVGGSGLSLYLFHRLSEDLDFFTWQKELDKEQIFTLLNSFKKYQLLNVSNVQIDCLLDNVKVTFFANNWNLLKQRNHLIKNVFVATPELLTTMKINTLFLRAKYRDYYDLYTISRELFNLSEMYALAEKNLKGITKKLFQMALLYIDDIQEDEINYLSPKYEISKIQIAKYFEKEVQKFKL